MFVQRGEWEAPKSINGLSSIMCNVPSLYIGIYCLCMFYLSGQDICPIVSGIHIKGIMHTNVL